jgi:hypothetical protein
LKEEEDEADREDMPCDEFHAQLGKAPAAVKQSKGKGGGQRRWRRRARGRRRMPRAAARGAVHRTTSGVDPRFGTSETGRGSQQRERLVREQ